MMRIGSKAWLLIAIPDRRQYGGNLGYDDDPANTYRYDSAVPNSRWVSQGDLVLLRDRKRLLGMGLVERIISGPGTKKQFRCPDCKVTGIKERQRLSPRWRCNNGHTFAEALEEEVTVTLYEAHYGSTYLSADGRVSASEIRSTTMRPSDQLSIQELDPVRLEELLMESFPEAAILFPTFVQSISIVAEDPGNTKGPVGEDQYTPSFSDNRKRVLRAIRERRGQGPFRKKLIRRYGGKCMISGCDLLDVVEAAHVWPYRGPKDNHPDNGLLLKADLHTLFDLNLLGIHPDTLSVSIAKDARRGDYAALHGCNLVVGKSQKPSRAALAKRWNVFSRWDGNGDSGSEEA